MKLIFKSLLIIFFGLIIPIFFYFNPVLAANENIIINELMYNPKGNDDGNEWLEILNISQNTITLNTNWRLYKASSGKNHIINQPVSGDFSLEPQEFAILTTDPQIFLSNYPNFNGTLIKVSFGSLLNSSDTLKILDDQKNEISVLNYSKDLGGYENNKTLEIVNPLNPSILKESLVDLGTPGKQNSVFEQITTNNSFSNSNNNLANNNQISIPTNTEIIYNTNINTTESANQTSNQPTANTNQETINNQIQNSISKNDQQINQPQIDYLKLNKNIFINEIMVNPAGSDEENEWIEIYNQNDIAIDISDWQIKNNDKLFKIPKNTKIEANSFLVFSRPTTKITLSNNGGLIELLDNQNNLIQKLNYPKALKKNISFARKENNSWEFTSVPTPNSINIFNLAAKTNNKNSYSENETSLTAEKNINHDLNLTKEIKTIDNPTNKAKKSFYLEIFLTAISVGFASGILILIIKKIMLN